MNSQCSYDKFRWNYDVYLITFNWTYMTVCLRKGLQVYCLIFIYLISHFLPFFKLYFVLENSWWKGFTGGSDGKEYACNAGDPGFIPRLGRSPGKESGYPFQHILENSMDRGAWSSSWGHKESDTTEWLTHSFSS